MASKPHSTFPLRPKGQENGNEDRDRKAHLSLLTGTTGQHELVEAVSTPIFTMPVLKHAETMQDKKSDVYPQYGLLAGKLEVLEKMLPQGPDTKLDPRLFFNIAAPSSTFICGSQGSGKSHTLSCLLENCLLPSKASTLPHPLAGLVFHYDTFISDDGGSPCEAAFLSSNPNIKVRVLCSPTNIATIKVTYSQFKNVQVEPLRIDESNLNTKRMLDMMAVKRGEPLPLYLHSVMRILRAMRMKQQAEHTAFTYKDFKAQIMDARMSPAQIAPLEQRLSTLESFLVEGQTGLAIYRQDRKRSDTKEEMRGNAWAHKPGYLTIVDLSCPCVTPEDACSLFNVCLTIFLEQEMTTGRVVALDEAHKYMNTSAEADVLTSTLLSTIRLQRHLGARIIISTQEPTISPALLDLSSVTIVHRFTSPDWLRALKQHLAAAASDIIDQDEDVSEDGTIIGSKTKKIFQDIVKLRVGEALLFSPSALVDVEWDKHLLKFKRLGTGYLKVKVRSRLTEDGGKSTMAS
ncbi:hypothetical protein PVAG01_09028 [Phlyctema vagabunda]|uniref:P-loop containing nucleoside triphosphate hydrolase protein n=1 Tax=Phlyctema vagabunda TaxID=108571 RepID=A0ABR4P6L0_9HELO